MEWFRAQPYLWALAVAAILVVGGAFVVESRSPVSPASSNITWGSGALTLPSQATSGTGQTPAQIAQEVVQGQAENVTLPVFPASNPQSSASSSGSFDYASLLSQLSASSGETPSSGSSAQSSPAIAEAYQLIPATLVATTSGAQPMTAQQQALYEYGNEVGGEIQSFEELHTNEADVIKDQAEDRTDPTKAQAVVSLGQGLASVGTFMQQMQQVPASAQPLHEALAQSYLDIGAKLQLVPQAQTDAQFVQAVENYDSAADTFVQNYAALATFFSAQGVTFSPQDPGSVFSFTNSSAGGL